MRARHPSALISLCLLALSEPASAAVDCTTLSTDAEQIDCLNDRVEFLISLMKAQDAASADQESRLSAIEADYATEVWVASQGYATEAGVADLSTYLSVDTSTDSVIFSGANVFVQSGAGSTDAAVNGLGNLIVGYDETSDDDKSGSHNLIVGAGHTYTSYGGVVFGFGNAISGEYAAVTGGYGNTVSGARGAVGGGISNVASGADASVSGGYGGEASGVAAAVSGGFGGVASGAIASVSGGYLNTAAGDWSSASGGQALVLTDDYDAQGPDLSGYADAETASQNADHIDALDDALDAIATDYLTSADLLGYATELYVDDAVLALDVMDFLVGYATEDWVASQGYATEAGVADLSTYLSVDTSTDSVIFSGANVYIQSGAGSTDAAVNGLGNLIVGYDEDNGDDKSGSHNLVLGKNHSYSAYGGVLSGTNNTVSGAHSASIAGTNNAVSETLAATLAGGSNTVSASRAAAIGGGSSTVSGDYAVAVGGGSNTVSGERAVAVSGSINDIGGAYGALIGGSSLSEPDDFGAGLSDHLSVDAATDSVVFSGANVYVQSGSGYTDDDTTGYYGDGTGSLTGLGNLIIGYSKDDFYGPYARTGSHNLVVGDEHDWTGYGGLVAGWANAVSGGSATVAGGTANEASGSYAAVLGGVNNLSSGSYAAVSGGEYNTASATASAIGGGVQNLASAYGAAVAGGALNTASGYYSVVLGGSGGVESDTYGAGALDDASGISGLSDYLSVDTSADAVIFSGANVYVQSGSGYTDDNTTTDYGDGTGSLTGLGNLIIGYAMDDAGNDDRGGSHNLVVGDEHDWTSFGGVVAGFANTVSGPYAAVTGGWSGTASGEFASVTGGSGNIASGEGASVNGGRFNTASGYRASVAGGRSNLTSHDYAAAGGGNGNASASSYDFDY